MWLALITGFWLWLAYFPLSMNWMWAKLILVAGLVGYHHVCKGLLRAFEARQNSKSHVWFRWFNEIPVIVLLVVVLLVVLKPF
jgi:putative membrane protein